MAAPAGGTPPTRLAAVVTRRRVAARLVAELIPAGPLDLCYHSVHSRAIDGMLTYHGTKKGLFPHMSLCFLTGWVSRSGTRSENDVRTLRFERRSQALGE